MENDASLATGVSSLEVNMFENEQPSDSTKELIEQQQKQINALLPTAQMQVDALNSEIAEANKLTDFVTSLGCLPSDVPEDDIRAKLEARFMYMNMLIQRKNHIIDGMRANERDIEDVPVMPLPLAKSVSLRPVQRVISKRPRGFKAVLAGIADLFRGHFM